TPRPLVQEGYIRFPADRIFKAVVESLVPGALEPLPPADDHTAGWRAGYRFETGGKRDRLRGTIGFRDAPDAEVRALLERNGSLAVKMHFALWARSIAEAGLDPDGCTAVTLSQLCDDLGYARLQNGAHRPESKR